MELFLMIIFFIYGLILFWLMYVCLVIKSKLETTHEEPPAKYKEYQCFICRNFFENDSYAYNHPICSKMCLELYEKAGFKP
jgi:hypothetical protein